MAAKTLKLCVESTTTLLNEDIQAFVDFPLEQRIRIFTQMSQILNLSFELFGLFKRRPLKMYDFGGDSRSGTQFNIGLTFGVAQQHASTAIQKKTTNKKHRKRKRSPKAKERAGQDGVHGDGAEQLDDLDFASGKTYEKDPTIDYNRLTLIQIVKQKEDPYSINLIFGISRSIFRLTKQITFYPVLHPELLASGIVWQAIQHCYFDLTANEHRRKEHLKVILKHQYQ